MASETLSLNHRFMSFDGKDVEAFIEEEQNENTKRKTKNDITLLNAFLQGENESRRLEEIPPQDLDSYLSRFLLSVRKQNSDEYEPTTLRGMLASFERYLKRLRYSESIITGQSFAKTREVLKSKQKQLKRVGKGNKPQEASPLTKEEIDILYRRGVMGIHSPEALINTLWFNNCLHFGLRGGKEQRDLKWGDITLKIDSSGKEYLEYSTERQTKTRSGENPLNRRSVKPRMYENSAVENERNPVAAYKLYALKRPQETCQTDSPFYLSINHLSSEKMSLPETKWFKSQPMGVNKLNSIMKECALKAGLTGDKRITNHSARKTLVQKHDIPPNQIIQVTGHKNLMSVNNYSSLRDGQQEAISSLLSANSPPPAVQMQTAPRSLACSLKTTNDNAASSENNENQSFSLFKGNYITGGTFNVHVSTSSASSHTVVTESPRKKFRRLRVIESSDSSQDS